MIKSQTISNSSTLMLTLLLTIGVIGSLPNSYAWTTIPPLSPSKGRTATTTLLKDASEGEQEYPHHFNHDHPKSVQFLEQVRSLQNSFYQTNTKASSLDPTTGVITNLPLWKVGWTELPGRSNILQVDEPMYTHLFSSILARGNTKEQPWYFGSLYQAPPPSSGAGDGGRSKVLSPQPDPKQEGAFTLQSWHDSLEDGNQNNEDTQQSKVTLMGTLMRIADYRRLQDGSLFLLVEAMERFVVTDVQQELPYGLATVQLIPDMEEVDPNTEWVESSSEGDITEARSLALAESFQRYHPYEYDETFRLPPPNHNMRHNSQFLRSLLTLVVPYVPLSKTADFTQLKDMPLDMTKPSEDSEGDSNLEIVLEKFASPAANAQQPCLEQQLLQAQVLKEYHHPDEAVQNLSLDDLEYRLWMELNHFLKSTKTPVSPVLLGLIPLSHHQYKKAGEEANSNGPEGMEMEEYGTDGNDEDNTVEGFCTSEIDWPSNFSLRKIADDIAASDYKHNFVQVSSELPQHRRLRKLSYSITAVLEEHDSRRGTSGSSISNNVIDERFRQELLETASTRGRLERILERLEAYNSVTVWGEFE